MGKKTLEKNIGKTNIIKQEIKNIKNNWREKEIYKKGRKVAKRGGVYKDFHRKKIKKK